MVKRPDAYVNGADLQKKTDSWLRAVSEVAPPRPGLVLKPRRAALLVIDAIRYFTHPSGAAWLPSSEAVLPCIGRLIDCWREFGGIVAMTKHCHRQDDDGGMLGRFFSSVIRCDDIDSGLVFEPLPGDRVIRKTTYDAFYGTDLEEVLRSTGITQVLITGVLTHLCCETTARSAFVRGFEVYAAVDAMASSREELHLGSLLSMADGIGVMMDTAGVLRDLRGYPMKGPADIAVIGAGPAGCAAAIQATRLGLSVVLLDETGEPGGLVRNAFMVENYPGLEPMPGHVLAVLMADHLDRFDIRITCTRINTVRRDGDLLLSEGSDLLVQSRTLVIATGTVPLSAGIEGESNTDSVYFSPMEIPVPFPGEIAVIGGGEAAFDYALTAAGEGSETMLLVRGPEPSASGRLLHMVKGNERIRIVYDTTVGRVFRSGGRLMLHTFSKNQVRKIPTDALLVAVGRRGTHPVTEEGLLLEYGDELLGAEGTFTAGDVRTGNLGQACTAAGQGILAAGKAFGYIGKKGSTS